METAIASTTRKRRGADRGLARAFEARMGLQSSRAARLDRAIRWALVLSSVGLLLLGINP